MGSPVYPEPLRTAEVNLHHERPRIVGIPTNVLCRSLLLKLGVRTKILSQEIRGAEIRLK